MEVKEVHVITFTTDFVSSASACQMIAISAPSVSLFQSSHHVAVVVLLLLLLLLVVVVVVVVLAQTVLTLNSVLPNC